MERRLSPTPPREPENVEPEAVWEFDIIPVNFKTGPQTLSGGWEPVQVVADNSPDDVFLVVKRRIG